MRPADSDGDILPVLHSGEMFSGALAVASLVESRLQLYAGDWWENTAWGNEILRMLQEGRLTQADAQALSTYLTEYVRETSGVQDVTDVRFSVEGHRFGWECTVLTEYGKAGIEFEV